LDIRKLQRAIVDGLEDVKAQNIAVFNTEHLSPLFERVIIASGTSNRQTKALAASVRDAVKGSGLPVLRTEGEENGEWIIVDCGAAVAHIMQPAIRQYYHLEELWGSKPVKMRIDSDTHALPKAGAHHDAARAKAKTAATPKAAAAPKAARKPGAKKAAPAKAISRTFGVKGSAAKKSAVKTPARRTAVSASAATKKAPARKPAARKLASKTTAPRKTAARKAVPRRSPSKSKA
jgi:ribosome-associated protein